MLKNIDHIKNIIFDLGGVILDIDLLKGVSAMKQLGITDFESASKKFHQTNTFLNFEKGLISEQEFLEKLKEENKVEFNKQNFIAAWNNIIVGFRREPIELIDKLNKSCRFKTFLLSNTNSLHKDFYTGILREQYSINGLEDLFEKVYFSHEINMRKPDAEIYHYVLKDGKMEPEETLFIDDSQANIETAEALGLETFHLVEGTSVNDLFPEQQVAKWI